MNKIKQDIFSSFLILSFAFSGSGCSSAKRTPSSPPGGLIKSYPINHKFELEPEDEYRDIETIREGMVSLQESLKAKNKSSVYHRGTHAKGACLMADTEIFDLTHLPPPDEDIGTYSSNIAARLKRGIFSEPGNYPTRLRFANAGSWIDSDHVPDIRAVSFSIQNIPEPLSNPQGTMDFTANDFPTFQLNDAKEFAGLMQALEIHNHPNFKNLEKLATNLRQDLKGLSAGNAGNAQKPKEIIAYQKLTYWTTVPFSLGADEAVKYILTPCKNNHSEPLSTDPNALSNELTRNVNEDAASCFILKAQILNTSEMRDEKGQAHPETYWIENASVLWNENQAPAFAVGKITFRKNSIFDAGACENTRINVLQNSSDLQHGLGGINRARSAAEEASARLRLGAP